MRREKNNSAGELAQESDRTELEKRETSAIWVEVLSRRSIFSHPKRALFWRLSKAEEKLYCCACGACGGADFSTSTAPYLAFVRRRAVFDADATVFGICQKCAEQPKLRAAIDWVLPLILCDQYHIAELKLPLELELGGCSDRQATPDGGEIR